MTEKKENPPPLADFLAGVPRYTFLNLSRPCLIENGNGDLCRLSDVLAALSAAPLGVRVDDEPEAGEIRAVIVNAKWKPCVHGGGWWVAK